ncbi:unnamed protein product [Schistosoma guineensis]|nr:unnamed protein product [Schistosoma guineensis]
MESDDSCEIASVITRADIKSDLSDNQTIDWSNHQNLRKENYSSCDDCLSNVEVLSDSCLNKQFHTFSLKLREQGKKIKLLEQERIGFLEQIANLCSSLEKKQQELVDVLKLSEEKAKYHAHYMTEVSSLLAELKTLFSEHSNCFNPGNQALIDQGEFGNKNEVSNSTDTENVQLSSTVGSVKGACCSESQQDHRGRALINELSATVSAVKNMNSKKLIKHDPSPQTPHIFADTLSCKSLNNSDRNPIKISTNQLPNKLIQHTQVTKNPIASDVCILPSFCWNTDHVLYWLREYVCLPGGCLEAASRLRLDGKQLTSTFDRKIEKQLHLNDEGLRKKFFTALEDLRIHGPPGISRNPGPSHISYQWICDIWLKHHLGLVQLIPIFSIRRVDGRMLSSLITYKRPKHSIQHKNRRKSKDNHNYDNDNCNDIIISNPNDDIPLSNYSQQNLINLKTNEINGSSNNNDNISNHSSVKSISSVSSTSSITNAVQDSCSHNNSSNKYDNGNEYMERNWQVAGRKEMLHILLGLSHTSSSSSSSSGADLSVDSRYLLGKKEAESLRTAIELLHHHNFNIEFIEQIRAKSDLSELDLLYWTNDHIVKWLSDLGLSDFVHGIDASGLHGAYMVLDSTFDFNTLIKRLHIPLNVAVLCKLEENLQRILKPARHKIFRRRSISRLSCTNGIMQRSITSTNAINGSCLSLISSSESQTKSSTDNNSNKHVKMNGNIFNMNENKNTVVASITKTDVIRDAESLNLTIKDIDLTLNNPIGLTPRREKRRILTVTGDLMNSNRLTRVFTRGHKTSVDVTEQSNKLLPNTQVSKQLSVMGLNINNNGINVNSSNDNSDWSSDVEDKSSTLVRKTTEKSSDNSSTLKQLDSLDCRKTTPPRQVVQPHEAPLLDPFNSDYGRPRLRILLGQTNRLNCLTGTSSASTTKSNPNTSFKNISDHKNNLASRQSLAKSCITSTFTATSLVSKGSTNSINSISSSYIVPISKTDF